MTHAPPEATSMSSSQVKEREAAVQVRTEQHLPPEVRTRPVMSSTYLYLYLLLLLPPLSSPQSFHWGSCHSPQVQEDFRLDQYLGRWYLIQKMPAFFAPGKCISANYSLSEEGGLQVLTSQSYWDRKWVVEGEAVILDRNQPAKLSLNFFYIAPLSPTWVLSTDYDSYSVVYSCTDVLGVFHLDYGWILSRSASLPPDVLHRGEELLRHLGVDASKMQEVEQDCEEEGSITFSQSGLSMT
ncbi:apolipoprotein D isoform X2 [Oryzias melastigma]|uniref:apolipoprotein D isoform X2 n=1 Tax=Oryzias melastigma TaxID=30732 RepID=UPI000CF824FB|nr:apolipoprotein D isoform X2 [Oryzias melastigma]